MKISEKTVNTILDLAIYLNTSDIHISPLADISFLFFRIDGILHSIAVIPLFVHNNIVSRIKLLSGMNVAERRIPQDGAFSYETFGEKVDIRTSTLPTAFGEKVVMRILRKDISRLNLAFLGYAEHQLELVKKAGSFSHGMVIVSGPTGSGKSTTLYSLLRSIDYLKRNVVTVEDPIEYKFNFIYQTEVNEAIGYRFATALRSLMRQDPDVILVGEIRDEETAEISVSAANTGHLLLSTVHANDALTTVYRLLSLCKEKDVALAVLRVISAQRLVRKLCPFCKEEDPETLDYLKKKYKDFIDNLPFEPKVYKSKGCDKCRGIGYSGRSVVAEVLEFDTELTDAFLKNMPLMKIKELLKEKNFWDMEKSGIYKVLKGETDYKEVMRVVK
jgi:type IV pilus assembly protein PilB